MISFLTPPGEPARDTPQPTAPALPRILVGFGAEQPATLVQTTADNLGVWIDDAGNLMGVPPT